MEPKENEKIPDKIVKPSQNSLEPKKKTRGVKLPPISPDKASTFEKEKKEEEDSEKIEKELNELIEENQR